MLTFTQFQHVLSQSASHSLAKRAPGSEAVNLPHADMFLRMAYTQLGCWADQSQITFANNSHCLFFPNGVPGAGLYHISHKVKCQTQAEKYLNLFFEVVSCVLRKSPVRFGSVQVQHVSHAITIIFILWHLLENILVLSYIYLRITFLAVLHFRHHACIFTQSMTSTDIYSYQYLMACHLVKAQVLWWHC